MAEEKKESGKRIAVIRVRGKIGVKKEINDTLNMLRLYNNNYCVVLENTPSIMGMIKKVKDYVTWGEINDETFSLLVEKRGEEYKGRETDSKGKIKYKKFITVNGKKIKPFFRLNPPRKGYGKKGIKIPYKVGGALGDRGKDINDLIRRML